ncbi:MAG: TIGR03960 family B12-binding radical SAM protein [Candidatus Eisenbacteria bacterium]|uniref:TIGR03960 family B12-binding radical SAM protein n=1 Tax=Eiseniibacteriota bacterium TaxID=2212470 RepID=A0A948RWH5_UNCEI|nr:TIGR03960 family B12-binding radical SAM protein [Candidatus Eisenbacteria bacterium]MBU1950536.1 TIGR03960 family B12-binding radical SAM protein [Candidatus Eisenbacteria bacterium]MBU2690929.1 TIGR03960 family B12-binding radical SAM protein [Candidatus Eisenbacteria bacterium]
MDSRELRRRLEEQLPLVEHPMRYLGGELNQIRKDPAQVRVQWLLILPEVYEIGMSHQGLKTLYDILNRRPDALAERTYSPWIDLEARMRRAGIPLFSLETHRPAREFDIIGISLQYELTGTNILNLLDLAGIPIWQKDRSDDDPLIFAGGPVATNPEPLADFFDAILIGDGEEVVHAISDGVIATKGAPRAERLLALAQIEGIYVPSLYRPEYDADGALLRVEPIHPAIPKKVKRRYVADLNTTAYPTKPLVPLQEIVQDRLGVEVLRGCTQGCRYCQAGYFYRPLRERSVSRITELTTEGLRQSGWDEVSLVSLSTADHTQIEAITDVLSTRLSPDHIGISLPSLRADRFSVALADKVSQVRKSGFTFAPEAGTERLRFAINKQITDAEFYETVRAVYRRGWRQIKLYFMIGLPTETKEDLDGIVEMMGKLRGIGREFGGSVSVTASIGSFIPKSHTPFQWEPFESPDSLKEKIAFLKPRIETKWSRMKFHNVDSSYIEAVHSQGDRRLAAVIYEAWRRGARFDGWSEHFSLASWEAAFRAAGIDPLSYIRRKETSEPLPWDHIDILINKKFLIKDLQRAREGVILEDCRRGNCSGCGVPGSGTDIQLAEAVTAEELLLLKTGDGPAHGSSLDPEVPAQRIRLVYRKLGISRFIGHLDLCRLLARAIKLAGMSLAYSKGFNPRPKLIIAAPLSVGTESLCEIAVLDLMQPVPPGEICNIERYLPDGITVRDASEIETAGRRLTVAATSAKYLISMESLFNGSRSPRTPEWLHERLAAYAAAVTWEIQKQSKKGFRTIDLKRAVLRLEAAYPELEILKAAGWDSAGPFLALDVRMQSEGNQVASPSLILEHLFELDHEAIACVRCLRVGLAT